MRGDRHFDEGLGMIRGWDLKGKALAVDSVRILGMQESIVASGLPKVAEYDPNEFHEDVLDLYEKDSLFSPPERTPESASRHVRRAVKLASCTGGESHDCFLCGIVVQANITAPRYWWPEFQRYHFADVVSSTSTMHKLKAFVEKAVALQDEGKMNEYCKLASAHFSPYTHPAVINGFMTLAGGWVKQENVDIEMLKASLPEGWLQTARITTNYRQLKTMYRQRRNHRLQEWRDFCAWIGTLPMAGELILGKEDKGNE